MRRHGFRTTSKGVVIDGPRNSKREALKGAKVTVHKGGVVSTSYKQRRDYVYGMTPKEKLEFAMNPDKVRKEIEARLRKKYPLLRHARKIQTRLQWGAYQGTKDFNPNYFTKTYLLKFMEINGKRDKTRRKIDALTGFHFVIHVKKKKK